MVRALKIVVRGCTCVYTLEYSKGVMGLFMQHGCDQGSSKSFEDCENMRSRTLPLRAGPSFAE